MGGTLKAKGREAWARVFPRHQKAPALSILLSLTAIGAVQPGFYCLNHAIPGGSASQQP